MPIEDLKKPARVMCRHATVYGCGIHSTKPAECTAYKCLWLAFGLPFALKPSASGIVVSAYDEGPSIVICETHDGAIHESRDLLDGVIPRWSSKAFIIREWTNGRRTIVGGPRNGMDAFAKKHKLRISTLWWPARGQDATKND